jgi:hypothetical protein
MILDARRLDGSDWVMLGYLAGLALWGLAELLAVDGEQELDRDSIDMSESDGRYLSDRQLSRLEEGRTVVIERWHGHGLELSGSVVVDAETVEEGDR